MLTPFVCKKNRSFRQINVKTAFLFITEKQLCISIYMLREKISLLTSQTGIWVPRLRCFIIIQPGIKRMHECANIMLQISGWQCQVAEDRFPIKHRETSVWSHDMLQTHARTQARPGRFTQVPRHPSYPPAGICPLEPTAKGCYWMH
jgi:hypothetical protein